LGLGMFGDHLGPQEPGQLAGDGDDRHLPALLAGGQAAEAATQAQLRLPPAGDHFWWQALLAAAQLQGGLGSMLVGPGRLDQLGAQMGVATLGDATPPGRAAAGVLAWGQPAEPHELRRAGAPAPVAHLPGQRQRAQPGQAPIRAQASDRIGEWWLVVPGGQVGLDGSRAASRAVRVAR
jgi:hypothetical protein